MPTGALVHINATFHCCKAYSNISSIFLIAVELQLSVNLEPEKRYAWSEEVKNPKDVNILHFFVI